MFLISVLKLTYSRFLNSPGHWIAPSRHQFIMESCYKVHRSLRTGVGDYLDAPTKHLFAPDPGEERCTVAQ